MTTLSMSFILSFFFAGEMTRHWERMGIRQGPTAIVLQSPGQTKNDVKSILDALWLAGFDVHRYEFASSEHSQGAMTTQLQKELMRFGTNYSLISIGFGGRIAAQMLSNNALSPKAAAFISVPLQPRCSPALRQSLSKEIAEKETLIAFGSHSPPDFKAAKSWQNQIRNWCDANDSIDLTTLKLPHWHGGSGLDNIAPPESIRPHIGNATFYRAGPLSLSITEPNHVQMPSNKPLIKALVDWLTKQETP